MVKARFPRGIEIKTDDQLRTMRRASLVVARALREVRAASRAGMSTRQLDDVAREVLAAEGAGSSFLDYDIGHGIPPYPAVTCVSVNEEIVHGIPGDRVLADGDLVSVDFGAVVEGFHGDSAVSFVVGDGEHRERRTLSDDTREALWRGIAAARIGGTVGDISWAVESYVRSRPVRYGIVAEYTGHGIGTAMHQPPDVPNLGRKGRGPTIVRGMCLAIEPMLTLGRATTDVLADDWTVVTADGSDAAHWEHTITVTKHGVWVLTADDGGEQALGELGIPFGPLSD